MNTQATSSYAWALPQHLATLASGVHTSPSLLRVKPPDAAISETLQEYLKVVMALKYEEKPPYTALRNSLEALLQDLRVSAYDPLDLQMAP
ncbi:Inactive serine/threonine-protein kinase VRK3 [Camelus dromedarius]|uniref:Inactive serine/threonine-protein kinase VRK3 n=1 Tax=Camelus dromedarius TaxID=9838 RepID=A0A5N4DUC4_CAMDR|nr:Inactive serine/threonine-protein kinase VRK3 [Camelus dromedarius]